MPENKIPSIVLKRPVTTTEMKGKHIQIHKKWEVISRTVGILFSVKVVYPSKENHAQHQTI